LADDKMNEAKLLLDGSTNENLYHYNNNIGSLNFYKGNYGEALRGYIAARDLGASIGKIEHTLYFNIAFCYYRLGMYIPAITTLERAYPLYNNDKTMVYGMYLDNLLAVCYIRIGHSAKAKQLLDECLIKAKGIGHKYYAGIALHNHGIACLKTKDYEQALQYFESVFEYFTDGESFYFENLFYKIYCLIVMKSALAKGILTLAKPSTEQSEEYNLLFTSLEHLMTLKNSASVEYIETKTIPSLIEKHEYFRVLDFYEVLESFYWKKESKIKALETKALAYDVYKKITQRCDEHPDYANFG